MTKTEQEREATEKRAKNFDVCKLPTEEKLANFPVWIGKKAGTRFLALYEIYKQILEVKGSVIECGVHHGFGLMSWAWFSAILEPTNFTRRIYGFDTFAGFESVSEKDAPGTEKGDLAVPSYPVLKRMIQYYDDDRYLGHMPKVELIRGDACDTIPNFVNNRKHLVVALLFMDFDLYEPTKRALECFTPRMPIGSILCFDNLEYEQWPGEPEAVMDTLGISQLRLKRIPWQPNIAYAVIE